MLEPQIDTDEHRLNELSFQINGCAMNVLNVVGHGYHEKIYENALALAFAKRGIGFSKQRTFELFYEDQAIGTFIPDFVVENEIIVELKTIDIIGNNEMGQVLNYLRASGLRLGIILNFKNPRLEWQRVVL